MRRIEKHAIAVNSTSGLRSVPNPKKVAKKLQAMGTKGDKILAHINANEATLLDLLADGRLDGGGRNKRTGLKSFGDEDDDGNTGNTSNAGENTGGMDTSNPNSGVTGNEGPSPSAGGNSGSYRDDYGLGNDGRGFHPENNPELGGGRARGRGLASVSALGPTGRNVHAAGSVMAGEDPSFGDRTLDFLGWEAPMGIPGSRAANVAATIAGTILGGAALGPIGAPLGAALASVAHNTTLGGRSLMDTAPGAIGGFLGGGLGSVAAQTIADSIRGKEYYDAPMTENDRARRNAELDAEARGERRPGSEPGSNDGSRAGVAYLKEPAVPSPAPAPIAAPAPGPLPVSRDGWDEDGFLTRNPEVARAVQQGIWTSGRAFDTAYKNLAGSHYDSAKALKLISPYTNDLLETRSGQALPYRG